MKKQHRKNQSYLQHVQQQQDISVVMMTLIGHHGLQMVVYHLIIYVMVIQIVQMDQMKQTVRIQVIVFQTMLCSQRKIYRLVMN